MKLTEAEMRMVFQIESTNQNAALNEIYMTWRYAPNPATKETAEGLLDKLRPLSDQECMDLIRKVQTEYRLPEKARTIGEMLAEARQRSGAQKLSGHDIMALERFDPATRHMIVFDVLTHDSPVGWKGEKMRLFLTDTGYSKALENQEKGHIKIRNHAKVLSGDLHYPGFEAAEGTPPYWKVRTDAPGIFKRSPPSQIEHIDTDREVMDIPCRPERTGTGTVRHHHGADESCRGRD